MKDEPIKVTLCDCASNKLPKPKAEKAKNVFGSWNFIKDFMKIVQALILYK